MRRRTSSESREHVQARHAHRAGGRRQETGKNPHGRALARAVGAEQADDFARARRVNEMSDTAVLPA